MYCIKWNLAELRVLKISFTFPKIIGRECQIHQLVEHLKIINRKVMYLLIFSLLYVYNFFYPVFKSLILDKWAFYQPRLFFSMLTNFLGNSVCGAKEDHKKSNKVQLVKEIDTIFTQIAVSRIFFPSILFKNLNILINWIE